MSTTLLYGFKFVSLLKSWFFKKTKKQLTNPALKLTKLKAEPNHNFIHI